MCYQGWLHLDKTERMNHYTDYGLIVKTQILTCGDTTTRRIIEQHFLNACKTFNKGTVATSTITQQVKMK